MLICFDILLGLLTTGSSESQKIVRTESLKMLIIFVKNGPYARLGEKNAKRSHFWARMNLKILNDTNDRYEWETNDFVVWGRWKSKFNLEQLRKKNNLPPNE